MPAELDSVLAREGSEIVKEGVDFVFFHLSPSR